MDAACFTRTELTPEAAVEHDRVYGALAEATRLLCDAQLRTRVDHREAEAVTAAVRELAERLAADVIPGAHGTELGPGPTEVRNHGNAVSGLRNPFAVFRPEHRTVSEDGHLHYTVDLGAGFEGPPGLVHGGVGALLMDQLLGEAAALGGAPGMTGRLTVHYRRPTPLGTLVLEGWLDSTEGRRSLARGQITDADGRVTITAEGLFVLPRWAAAQMEARSSER